YAHWLSRVGRHEEALASLERVLPRDPFPPSWYSEVRSVPLLALKRYEEAIEAAKNQDQLSHWNYAYMAACYAHLGRMDEARISAAKVLQMRPDFTIHMN